MPGSLGLKLLQAVVLLGVMAWTVIAVADGIRQQQQHAAFPTASRGVDPGVRVLIVNRDPPLAQTSFADVVLFAAQPVEVLAPDEPSPDRRLTLRAGARLRALPDLVDGLILNAPEWGRDVRWPVTRVWIRPLLATGQTAPAGPPLRGTPLSDPRRGEAADGGPVVTLFQRNDPRSYRGTIEIRLNDARSVLVINHLPIESYVEGVTACEMAPSWPLEALKAQAVISRSVARAKVAEAARTPTLPYDLMDGLNDQDYRGAGRHGLLVTRAVAETRGVVTVVKGGSLFQPLFCAASGGWTAASDAIQPGLKDLSGAVLLAATVMRPSRDPASEAGARALSDLSTHHRSEVQIKAETIRRGLARLLRPRGIEVGWIRDIRVVERERASGRALRVRINQLPGDPIELSANEFRLAITDERGRIPIRSTLWSEDSPKRIPDSQGRNDFAFTCFGLGHGVGLSQVSAWWLASEGKTAREILERFYGGDQLRLVPAW